VIKGHPLKGTTIRYSNVDEIVKSHNLPRRRSLLLPKHGHKRRREDIHAIYREKTLMGSHYVELNRCAETQAQRKT